MLQDLVKLLSVEVSHPAYKSVKKSFYFPKSSKFQ